MKVLGVRSRVKIKKKDGNIVIVEGGVSDEKTDSSGVGERDKR